MNKTYWAVVDSRGFILYGNVRLTKQSVISSVVANTNVGLLFQNSRVPREKQYNSKVIWRRLRQIGYRTMKFQIEEDQ